MPLASCFDEDILILVKNNMKVLWYRLLSHSLVVNLIHDFEHFFLFLLTLGKIKNLC